MKVEHIKADFVNPFINATEETFRTMCKTEVERCGPLSVRCIGASPAFEIIGTINLSGEFKGQILMTMGRAPAKFIVKNFQGEEVDKDSDLADAFGEIINMISGSASAKLGKVKIAPPSVFMKDEAKVQSVKSCTWMLIPFKFDEFRFNIEVSIKEVQE